MSFWNRKRAKITVFISHRQELLSMAEKLLQEEGISFVRKPAGIISGGEGAEPQQLQVEPAAQEQARKVLRSLAELDTILCAQ